MDFDWFRIGQAALLVMFIVVLFPAAKWWNRNSPKAGEGDWMAFVLAIAGIALFVFLLMSMVR